MRTTSEVAVVFFSLSMAARLVNGSYHDTKTSHSVAIRLLVGTYHGTKTMH